LLRICWNYSSSRLTELFLAPASAFGQGSHAHSSARQEPTWTSVWPSEFSMTTIHTKRIWAWAQYGRKPFGMGCYGH